MEPKATGKKVKKKAKSANALKIYTGDSSHVRPLLERLIDERSDWANMLIPEKATLRWVHPNWSDDEVL